MLTTKGTRVPSIAPALSAYEPYLLDVGCLLGIVFVMTAKPVRGEWVALGIAAAIPVVFVVIAALLFHPPAARAAMEGPSS